MDKEKKQNRIEEFKDLLKREFKKACKAEVESFMLLIDALLMTILERKSKVEKIHRGSIKEKDEEIVKISGKLQAIYTETIVLLEKASLELKKLDGKEEEKYGRRKRY